MRNIVFAILAAFAALIGGRAQAAAPCTPFTSFPLVLNFGTGLNTGTGEDLNCFAKKVQASVNTLGGLPSMVASNTTALAALNAKIAAANGLATLGADGLLSAAQAPPALAANTAAMAALSAKLGAPNGIATLGSDGILTAAQRPPSSGGGGGGGSTLPYVYAAAAPGNVVADGATDQSANITAAMNTCSARGCVLVLPCGDIAISTLNLTVNNVVYQSASPLCSTLTSLNTTGDVVTLRGDYGGFQGVGFKQKNGAARTTGYTVNMTGAYQFMKQVHMESCYRCIQMAHSAGWGRVEDVDLIGITPDSVAAGSGGIQVWNPRYGPSNRIDNVLIYGPQDGDINKAPLWGINIRNSGATILTNFDILGFKNNLLVNPNTDATGKTNNPGGTPTVQTSQALRVGNGYFDSQNGSANVLFQPAQGGYIFNSVFVGAWLVNGNNSSSNGFEVNTSASTRTDSFAFKDLTLEASFVTSPTTGGNNGFLCTYGSSASQPNDINIVSSLFAGWGQGINLGCSEGSLIGNRAGPYSPFGGGNGPSNSNGIFLNAGIDNWLIQGNRVKGNAVAGVNDGATGTSIRITDNLGYNGNQPATAVTVGASPFTYTAGHTPETIYMIGGTTSSVVAPGGNKTLAGGQSGQATTAFQLGPNEQIVINYSAAPVLTRVPH